VWAVAGPAIGHRTGGAWTWEAAPDGMSLNAVWGSGASDVWAVGENGGVARFDGVSWSPVTVTGWPDFLRDVLYAVWGTSASDVWAAGASGRVLHWNGTAWTVTIESASIWYGLWGSSPSNVFLVGWNGAIKRWNGTAWTPMNSGTTEPLLGVWGSGPGDVYAVALNGAVLHFDGNAAGTWTTLSTPLAPGFPAYGVWGSGPDDVYVLANSGKDLVHWDGTRWRTVSSRYGVGMLAIWGSGSRDIYTGGAAGTILHGRR
jgi:hypothetical protein